MRRAFQVLLHPIQADFLSCPARIRSFTGGRGSGKSFIGAYDLLIRSCAKAERLYMVVAPTYATLRNASMRTFLKLGMKMGKIAWVNRSDLRIGVDSGSEIIFRSAEHPDRLRGPNLSGVWMDESQNVDEEAYSISLACLREAGENGFLTATFTPNGRRHWTYERFGRNEELRRMSMYGEEEVDPALIDPNVYLFHATTRDNPFLPEGFEDMLRRQYTSALAEQELEGEFTDMAGTMFKRKWFDGMFVEVAPMHARRVRYWDKASCLLSNSMVACERGDVQIKDVVAGDRVLTRNGFRSVVWAGLTKLSHFITSVSLSNGQVLSGTPDHCVRTVLAGWKALGMLGSSDCLLSPTGEPVWVLSSESRIRDEVPVYDLTVEGDEEFFANGVLVHNSKKGGSWTAGVLIAWDYDGVFYVEHVVHGQWTVHERDKVMKITADEDNHKYGYGNVRVYVEQEPGSGGAESAQNSIRLLVGNIVRKDKVTGKKHVRAEPFAAQCEGGMVRLVTSTDRYKPWITDFLDELCFEKRTRVATIDGDVAIEDVRPGDQVMTRAGWKSVKAARQTNPAAQICQINTTGGSTLKVTPNHPILVLDCGFIAAGQLRAGDVLLRYTGESPTPSIPIQDTEQEGATSPGSPTTEERSSCTASSTSPKLAASQMGLRSTTSMKSPGITLPPTSSPCHALTTRERIEGQLFVCASCVRGATQQHRESDRGLVASLAETSVSTLLGTRSSTRERARCAMCSSVISTSEPCTADRSASGRLTATNGGSSRFHVDGAEPLSSQPTPGGCFVLDVVESSPVMLPGRHAVYNLEVEEANEFFAEGILVHNCQFPDGNYSDQCLVAGTMVATPDGDVPIETLHAGDCVLTRNGIRHVLWGGRTGVSTILVEIILEDGRWLRGTPEHPILCRDGHFTKLGEMTLHAKLLVGGDLRPVGVKSVRFWRERADVFNLTVEGDPEFYANGILVHNCDASSGAFNALIKGSYSAPAVGGSPGGPAMGSIGQNQGRDLPSMMRGGPTPSMQGGGLRNFRPL